MLNSHLIDQKVIKQDLPNASIISYANGHVAVLGNDDTGIEISNNFPIISTERQLIHPSQILAFAFSNDFNDYIWVRSTGIQIGDKELFHFESPISYAQFSPKTKFLIFQQGSNISLLEFSTQSNFQTLLLCEDFSSSISDSKFREDELFVAFASDYLIRTYSTDFNKQEKRYKNPKQLEGEFSFVENSKVHSLCWRPNGTWLAVSINSQIQFFEKNLCQRQTINVSEPIISLHWSDDSDLMVALSNSGKLYIFTEKNRAFHQKLIIPLSKSTPYPLIIANHFTFGVIFTENDHSFLCAAQINRSVDRDSNDIFVTNGNLLHISHWSKSLIPPPLSHVTEEFDSQITCIVPKPEMGVIFTLTQLYLISAESKLTFDLPLNQMTTIVNSACWRDEILVFSSGQNLFSFNPKSTKFELISTEKDFISFVTPSQTLLSGNIEEITEYGNVKVELTKNHDLYLNGTLKQSNVRSYIADGKLLAYIYNDIKLHICYDNQETEHEVEALAFLLYFSPKIFSIIIQMHRGNTETQAPHIIVESTVRDMIIKKTYSEALQICRRYMVPFSKFISLGNIDIETLLHQCPDSKLRPFISTLNSENDHDRQFIQTLLGYILKNDHSPFTNDQLDSLFVETREKSETELAKLFSTCVCISFVLLRREPKAVQFACSFSDGTAIRSSIQFLLTLYDADRLYDIALQTYDVECIGSVAIMTMQEPSSYVPFLEELKSMSELDKRATIDERVGNWAECIRHLAAGGPQNDERCFAIIEKERLYDVGLASYPRGSPNWMKIAEMKLQMLESSRRNAELASSCIDLAVPQFIIKHIKLIVQNDKLWPSILPICGDEAIPKLRDALAKVGKHSAAADIADKIGDKISAQKLRLKAHEWSQAIEAGLSPDEVCRNAMTFLVNEAKRHINEADNLRAQYNEAINQDENGQRRKKQMKLEGILRRVAEMIPSQEKVNEILLVENLMEKAKLDDMKNELAQTVKQQITVCWPTPDKPNDAPLPDYLKPIA